MKFSRQEHWSGLPPPSAGDLPDPEVEPGSPAPQADSPAKPLGKLNRDLNSIPCHFPLRMEAWSLKGMTVPAFSEGHAQPERCPKAGQGVTHPQVKPRYFLYEGWDSPVRTAKEVQQAQSHHREEAAPSPGPTAVNTGSGKTSCVCNTVGML